MIKPAPAIQYDVSADGKTLLVGAVSRITFVAVLSPSNRKFKVLSVQKTGMSFLLPKFIMVHGAELTIGTHDGLEMVVRRRGGQA